MFKRYEQDLIDKVKKIMVHNLMKTFKKQNLWSTERYTSHLKQLHYYITYIDALNFIQIVNNSLLYILKKIKTYLK